MEIWFNPSCSKCRAAKARLDAAGESYVERRYLENPPSVEELTDVLRRLGLEPWELARDGNGTPVEALPRDAEHRGQWIAAMVAHPALIQRPVIVADDGTVVVGRTPEALEKIISAQRPRG